MSKAGKAVRISIMLGLCVVLTVFVFVMEDTTRISQMPYNQNLHMHDWQGDAGTVEEFGAAEVAKAWIESLSINGYEAKVTQLSSNISMLVLDDADMDHILVEFVLDASASAGTDVRLMMGGIELESGEVYKFEELQVLTIESLGSAAASTSASTSASASASTSATAADGEVLRAYTLRLHKVDTVVDSGLPTVLINTAGGVPVVDKVNQIEATMATIAGSLAYYGGSAQNGNGGSAQNGNGGSAQNGNGGSAAQGGSAQNGNGGSAAQGGNGGSAQNGNGGSAARGASAVRGEAGLYHGPLTIRGRGNSSWAMPKKAYKIAPPKNEQFLDMPAEDDWVLIGNYADKTLMRNVLAYEFARSLDMAYTPRMRFVELFLNGEYLGNFIMGEQIKIAKNRLDINKLARTDNAGEAVTGGYIVEKDWLSRVDETDRYFTTTRFPEDSHGRGDNIFTVKRPSARNISQAQFDYIAQYFQEAEDALYSDRFMDDEVGFRKYFDVDALIDWYVVNELFKNVDSNFGSSVYMFKDLNGKIHFGPVWDFDYGAGNVNYNGADTPEGFYVKEGYWIARFFEDPRVVAKLKARWNEIREAQIPALLTLIRNIETMLERSAEANFKRWDILGRYVAPDPPGYEERTTYGDEVDYMVDWLEQRIAWLDANIPEL